MNETQTGNSESHILRSVFITLLNFYFYRLKQTITKEDQFPCETYKLLGLEGEYTTLIVQLETELDLLGHIQDCSNCMKNLIEFIQSGVSNPNFKQFTRLFSGYDEKTDLIIFISTRINERIKQLNNLKEDAITELMNLRDTLNEFIQP